MRVIAGSLRGRRLSAPSWKGLRPTADQLRETIFNILAPRIRGARVLDGYAGTGALGIEALSRGAAAVTFVERDRRAAALIEENLARCEIDRGYAIIRASFVRAIEALREQPAGDRFDVVLLDPPYESSWSESSQSPHRVSEGRASEGFALGGPATRGNADAIGAIIGAAGEVMARDGVLVLEHARTGPAPEVAGRLVRTREVIAGDSALAFYTCRP